MAEAMKLRQLTRFCKVIRLIQAVAVKPNGATSGLEQWVKDNSMLAFVGVFALGYLLASKKGCF